MPRDTSNGRDPNWSEPETALLICLANHYITVLGSTSNDAKTIQMKQDIWEDIQMKMAKCNYNRCKERLRQKWQRLRAAVAKKERSMKLNGGNDEQTIINVEDVSENDVHSPSHVIGELTARLQLQAPSMTNVLTSGKTAVKKRGRAAKTTKRRGRAKRVKLNETAKNLKHEFN